eukprot:2313417-Pleurochrysis_carterae.AAC.1
MLLEDVRCCRRDVFCGLRAAIACRSLSARSSASSNSRCNARKSPSGGRAVGRVGLAVAGFDRGCGGPAAEDWGFAAGV